MTENELHDIEEAVDPLELAEDGAADTAGAAAIDKPPSISANLKSTSTVGGDGWTTDPTTGLTTSQMEQSREIYGLNVIPIESTPLYVLFLRQFVGFMPLLIEVAAIISIAVQDYVDFGIVLAMLLVNGLLGFREEYHAKLSLDELSKSIESEITVIRNGGTAVTIKTAYLVPGDIVLLVGGVVIPADVKWIKGDYMSIDTAALTGEPIPRKYPSSEYGDVMYSGTTVKAGECYGQVLSTGTNTEVGKAQADVMKDKSIRIISVFQMKIMLVVQAVVGLSLLVVVAVLLVLGLVYDGFEDDVQDTILSSLSIMIAAIPVALPLVLQVNMALGAAYLAKHHHAIVTSIPALQDIASMSILCSDKTGTLTTAKMSVITHSIFAVDDFTVTDVLLYAYLCSNPNKKDDPIDRAVCEAFEKNEEAKAKYNQGKYHQEFIMGFNPEVKRTVGFVSYGSNDDGESRNMITVAKGLPAKIMNTRAGHEDDHEIQWRVEKYGNRKFVKAIQDVDRGLSKAGYKTIAIAVCDSDARKTEEPVFRFVGLLPMIDPPREDTARTIASLHHANISVKMITGDHVNVGKETARLIGLGTNIEPGESIRNAVNIQAKKEMIWEADGFASVLPSDKREVVLTLRNEFNVVTGMTGDGVNDAPALSAAQVGIAVEGATDAAKNAADLILTEPGLSPIYGAVIESRRIFARVKSYVVYRIAASIVLVITLSVVIFVHGCAVDSLLVIILALLNDISMIPVAYDNAVATAKPQLPKAGKLVLMSLYFGVVQTGLALLFFFVINNDDRLNGGFDMKPGCNDETRGFIWFHLVLATEFMIFSARAPSFFFQSVPSIYLVMSVLLTGMVGSLVANLAADVAGSNVGWIWLFNAIAFVIVDVGKVWFKEVIGESPGEIIATDDLIEITEPVTEARKHMEKKKRFLVHTQSVVLPEDRQHSIEITDVKKGFIKGVVSQFTELRPVEFSDGFINKANIRVPLAKPHDSRSGSFGSFR